MAPQTEVAWFRAPADDPGTLNACYNALDIHVIRGRADDVALADPAGDWTFARLLTEVAACAGVLRAFGVDVGDEVAVAPLPWSTGVVVALAVARVGAVSAYDDPPTAAVRLGSGPEGVVISVDSDDLPWDVVLRAGRTDPAGCSDVPGDAILSRHGDVVLPVLTALGASDDHTSPPPPGLVLVEVGGLELWSYDAPGAPDTLTR